MHAAPSPRAFTAGRFAIIIVAFFAVVIGVNVTMATLASRTFSGAIVRNGYVANQDFNHWLAAGRAQAALGWTVAAKIEGGRLVVAAHDAAGRPLDATISVTLRHPIDPNRMHVLKLVRHAGGNFSAAHRATTGQWDAEIHVAASGHDYRSHQRLLVRGA